MRIKIVKCSGDYWYEDEIGKEYEVIRQVESDDFPKYKLTENVDMVGDCVIEENPEEGTMLSIDQYDIEPIDEEVVPTKSESIRVHTQPTRDAMKDLLNDTVNHPSHYADGKIEVIEYIEDKKLNYNLGNAVKYISRAGKKDPTKKIEDLKKAVWYINREIGGNNK